MNRQNVIDEEEWRVDKRELLQRVKDLEKDKLRLTQEVGLLWKQLKNLRDEDSMDKTLHHQRVKSDQLQNILNIFAKVR